MFAFLQIFICLHKLLDTPCTAGARSTGRLNILYQFGFIRGQYLMVIRFDLYFHGCLHYRIKKVISDHFFFVTPPTSVQNSAIFAPFTKGKSHRPLFAFFPKNATFFRSEKGPNRPVPLANSFNGHPVFGLRKINGSNYRKDLQ